MLVEELLSTSPEISGFWRSNVLCQTFAIRLQCVYELSPNDKQENESVQGAGRRLILSASQDFIVVEYDIKVVNY